MNPLCCSLTLDSANPVWMTCSCTQRKVSMVPFVFSIPFVLSWGGSISSDSFLPSILLLVVIIITVVIVVVILIVVVVVIVGVVIVVAIIGVVVVVGGVSSILKLTFVEKDGDTRIQACFRDELDNVFEEEDGGWICILDGNNSSGIKKYRGSNSSDGGNTRDGVKIAGGVIGSSGGMGGISSFLEFSETSEEVFPGVAGK
ncbi:hypothetical protein Tco_0975686 [Tanacetum coccineum]|uniref:Transmembrane protein n=1 Tax=Tanacetum coccineum TaxID=301880 RepID=A0ABQ5EF41_9ASTR